MSRSRTLAVLAILALLLATGPPAIAQETEAEDEPSTESAAKGEAQATQGVPDPLNFRWMTISYKTAEGATDYIVMNGDGWVIDGKAHATGSYNHYAGTEADYCEVPKALLGYGIWKTDELGGVEIIGEYGAFVAGAMGATRPVAQWLTAGQQTLALNQVLDRRSTGPCTMRRAREAGTPPARVRLSPAAGGTYR